MEKHRAIAAQIKEHNRRRIGFLSDPRDGEMLVLEQTREELTMTRNTMRKSLLLGTVALMAGVGLASAQGMREGVGGAAGGGAEQHGTSSGSPAAKSQGGAEIQSKGKAETRGQGANEQKAQGAQPVKTRMSGQAKPERSTTGQGSSEKDELNTKSSGNENLKTKNSSKEDIKARSSEKKDLNSKASAKDSAKTGERSTTGQGTSEKTDTKGATDSKSQTQEKPAAGQNQTTGSSTQNQNATQTQSGAGIQSQAGTKITAQQQTTIQTSVLSARNAPRVDHVNFAVHTGVVVPRSVNVVAISTFPVLIETFPQYRDYSFFVVEDEIVFVDRGHKVVDVVPVGPRARFSGASSGSSAVVAVDLSEPEIREVQQVLVQRGFLHGHVTGVWSTESREALIAFQRKEGFEASGSVDTRTVGALGLSGKVKAQSSTSTQGSSSTTTTGQSQSGTSGKSTTGQNSPRQNQSTTGQDKSGTQKPSDKQSSGPSQSTTGQGSSSNPPSGGSSMNSSSSSSTSGSSGQSSTPSPEKNKQN